MFLDSDVNIFGVCLMVGRTSKDAAAAQVKTRSCWLISSIFSGSGSITSLFRA